MIPRPLYNHRVEFPFPAMLRGFMSTRDLGTVTGSCALPEAVAGNHCFCFMLCAREVSAIHYRIGIDIVQLPQPIFICT